MTQYRFWRLVVRWFPFSSTWGTDRNRRGDRYLQLGRLTIIWLVNTKGW